MVGAPRVCYAAEGALVTGQAGKLSGVCLHGAAVGAAVGAELTAAVGAAVGAELTAAVDAAVVGAAVGELTAAVGAAVGELTASRKGPFYTNRWCCFGNRHCSVLLYFRRLIARSHKVLRSTA